MKNRLLLTLSACAFLVWHPSQAQSQQQTPTRTGEIATWLTDRLTYVVRSCVAGSGPIKMREAVKGSKDASPVPGDMIDYINATNKRDYWSLGDEGTSRHFAFVFSEDDVEQRKFPTINTRYLAVDFDSPAEEMLLRTQTNFQHFEQSCDSAFKSASAAGGGLADDTLKAAGRVTVTGSQNRRASIVAGTFVSPFASAVRGSDTAQKFYSALILWDWRRRNENKTGYLLTQFNGYAMSTYVEKKSGLEGGANASAGLTLPFLSFRTTLDGKYHTAGTYKAELFSVISTAPLSGDINGPDYYTIPSESELNQLIGSTAAARVRSEDDVLIGGVTKANFVDVPWMPKIFCSNHKDYEITGPSKDLMAITQLEDKSAEGFCRFTVTYRSLQSNGTGSIDVPFEIHRKTSGLPSDMAGFSLPVSGLQFQWADIPKLAPRDRLLDLSTLIVDGNSHRLGWRAAGMVLDKDKLAAGAPGLSGLELSCKSPDGTAFRPEGQMLLSNRQAGRIEFQLTIEMLLPQSPGNDIRAQGKPFRACALSGTILYAIDGKTVTRPLDDLFYLKLPDLPAAPAP